ncbi:hypothetical protein [Hymenobacter terricola]|uniref:hypothetical protein n=1 Tax=Hymenobacter terricola TaxID=2819236 RepID=UPI001B3034F2|nr:hypothetical protein [Hymenobacter terricola]
MENLIVYCSQPASGQMATFLMSLSQAQNVVIRPVSEIPQPDALHLQRKRVERGDLLDAIEATETHLALYGLGRLQPDAGAEQGLKFTLESLKSRLNGVNTVLGSVEKGGVDNG